MAKIQWQCPTKGCPPCEHAPQKLEAMFGGGDVPGPTPGGWQCQSAAPGNCGNKLYRRKGDFTVTKV